MFKNALVSVSDKTGLLEFLIPLVQQGLRVVSTGGTAEFLKKNGISVVEVSAQTQFPEVMGGRVKTLHPKVHMGLLSRDEFAEDQEVLKKFEVEPFDLLICNLYPFEASVASGLEGESLIEKIDVGGPSMLRAAAKNFRRLTVLCDPEDYSWVAKRTNVSLEDRKHLAAKVFAHTSAYDSLVAEKLGVGWGQEHSIAGHKTMELRYGENPHQTAGWYRFLANNDGLHMAKVLQGKPLSYNNVLDLDAAVNLVRSLEGPSCVAVKHNNPCGTASANKLSHAVHLAIQADPVSVFGGILAVNSSIDLESAEKMSEVFLECIVAPVISSEAQQVFSKKKNLRVLEWPEMQKASRRQEIRGIFGGILIQSVDSLDSSISVWRHLGETPDPLTTRDLTFAEKICASLKSNAIALVKNQQTLGLGMGQVNRVEAVAHAIERMKKHHPGINGDIVMASDAFFPFADSIELAAAAGVRWVVQPGGSIKDDEVLARAKDLGVNMILTGVRHFRH